MLTKNDPTKDITFDDFKADVLNDYKIAFTSRECSLLGRREVLTGKAKFGIFGDLLKTSGWNFGVGTGKFHSTQSSNPKFATVPEVPQSSPKVSKVS